jgi:hypothetical protein
MGADHLTWATAGPKRKTIPIRSVAANANFFIIEALLCPAKLAYNRITCIDCRIQEEKGRIGATMLQLRNKISSEDKFRTFLNHWEARCILIGDLKVFWFLTGESGASQTATG